MRISLLLPFLVLLIAVGLHGQAPASQGTPVFPNASESVDELSPVLSVDGRSLWFLRKGTPRNMGEAREADVWLSYRNPDGLWSHPVNLGPPINSRHPNQVLAVSPSGHRLYLRQRDASGQVQLLYSDRLGRRWTTPLLLPVADTLRLGPHSSLSIGPDGRVMIISQMHPEDSSRYDLYYATRDPWGVWSRPHSLGERVNSPGQERKALLAPDGRSLYFSSNGRGGLGGTDIFRSLRLGDGWAAWSEPVPLGPVASTPLDDDGFAIPARGDYLMLARRDTTARDRLIQVPLPDSLAPQPVCLVQGSLRGEPPTPPDSLSVTFIPEPDAATRMKTIEPDRSGQFATVLPYAAGRGLLLLYQPGFFPKTFPLPDSSLDLSSLDRESEQLIADLQEDRAYQNREEKVVDLYQRLKGVESDLMDLDRTLNRLNNPPASWWPKLDTTLLPPSELEAVRARYETFRPDPENTSDTTRRSSQVDTLPEVAARLQRVRRRFMQTQESDPEAAAAYVREAAGAGGFGDLPSFSAFCRAYWRQQLARQAPTIRYELERQMIRQIIDDEASARRPDATKINALEARLATVRERLEDIEERPPRLGPPAPSWLDSLRRELDTLYAEPMKTQLEAAWTARVEQYIELTRRKFLRNRQRQNLQNDLDKLLAEQMEQEQNAMGQVPRDTLPGSRPEPASSFGFRRSELKIDFNPFAIGGRHVARSVTFLPNKNDLHPHAKHELDRLVDLLLDHPELGLLLSVHTHSFLTHVHSQRLSKDRADTLLDYFTGKGIPSFRLKTRGVGKLDPRRTDRTAHGRRANQRVEATVFLAAG